MLSFATRSLLRAPLLRAAAPRAVMRVPLAHIAPVVPVAVRMYSASTLSKDDISARILDVLKSFDKATPDKITTGATFAELGFDSLDSVEVVMAIEEEFNIEIPDAEADEITTVPQAIEYIAKTPEAS